MNSLPLISIIIPVYKVEKYLKRAVSSILNQTYENIEVILVDDGSPDNCPAICDEFAEKDSRVRVIHKENAGVIAARKDGVDAAKSDMIAFIDSDDWIEKDTIEYLYRLRVENDADVVGISCETCSDSGEPVKEPIPEELKIMNSFEYMKNLNEFEGASRCGKIYSKELWYYVNENFDTNDNVWLGEDTLFNYYIVKVAKKFLISNQKKYYYFRHGESFLSGCINNNIIDGTLSMYNTMEKTVDVNSKEYPYFVYKKILGDFFCLNSIIRNQACLDRYDELRQDILSYKKLLKKREFSSVMEKKHLMAIRLLAVSPKLYDKSILIRRNIRGY